MMSTVADSQFVDVEAVQEAIAAGRTLPTSWYSDPKVFDFELTNLFERTWHVVGPLEKLSKPGDHIVSQAGRIPIVVLRDQDGQLRGFVNVCRHRGYRVAREDGSRPILQCLYHGWTYNLDGTLRRAPRCAAGEFDELGLALLPVSVDVWNRFVFVNADPYAGQLLDAFPELNDVAAEMHLDPCDFSYDETTSVEILGNWKGWCENSVECYHCPTIHQSSFDTRFQTSTNDAKGAYDVATDNVIGATAVPREQGHVGGNDANGRAPGLRFVFLFPGTFIIQDQYVCFAGYTVPLAPDRTRFVAHVYVRDGVHRSAIDEWKRMWDQTFSEDADVVRLQQSGYAAGKLDYGQLSQHADNMILKFHELTWRHYREILSR